MEYVEDEFCNKSLGVVINCSIEFSRHLSGKNAIKPEAVAVPLTFAIIFLIGVTGNVLLTLNFARHKKLSTPHNALVVNLAAGDLLMLAIGLPFNSVWYTVPHWPFGDLLCRLSRFAETFATAVIIATLTILSVERFFIVTGRRRHHQLTSMPVTAIIVIWVTGLVLGLPDLISATVVQRPIDNSTELAEFCFDYNPAWGSTYPQLNVMSKFLLLFLLPLLVIAPCHLALAFHLLFKMFGSGGTPTSRTPLRAASKSPHTRRETDINDDRKAITDDKEDNCFQGQKAGSSQNDVSNAVTNSYSSVTSGSHERKRRTPSRKRRRLAVTVLGLVLSFVTCWLPRYIFLLWYHFDPSPFNKFWHVFKIFGFCLMFSNSAVNPFVFYVLDLGFRAFVHTVVLCQRRNSDETEYTAANPETAAVEVTAMEERKVCIVMSELPAPSDRVDIV